MSSLSIAVGTGVESIQGQTTGSTIGYLRSNSPLTVLRGIGRSTARCFELVGIHNITELAAASEAQLHHKLLPFYNTPACTHMKRPQLKRFIDLASKAMVCINSQGDMRTPSSGVVDNQMQISETHINGSLDMTPPADKKTNVTPMQGKNQSQDQGMLQAPSQSAAQTNCRQPPTQTVFSSNTPPPGYRCHRCGETGHFIRACPTNGDPAFDIRRPKNPTGIPRNDEWSQR